jgi:hypothetical protein
LSEQLTGIANTTGNIVLLDRFSDSGVAKRPYGLGDLAATFFATDKFSISESFRIDNFRINGGDGFQRIALLESNCVHIPAILCRPEAGMKSHSGDVESRFDNGKVNPSQRTAVAEV